MKTRMFILTVACLSRPLNALASYNYYLHRDGSLDKSFSSVHEFFQFVIIMIILLSIIVIIAKKSKRKQ